LLYDLRLPLLCWENQKHEHLRCYCEFCNYRRATLQTQKHQEKHHRKPLPSRTTQPLKPVGQNEELLRRQAPDIRRLSPRAKARYRKKG